MGRLLNPAHQKVYPYDFHLPNQMQRPAQDALKDLCVSWARLVSSAMTPRLATATTIAFEGAEQRSFAEVLNDWQIPLVLMPFSGLLPGTLACDLPTAHIVAYRLLGGLDEGIPSKEPLTDFEQKLWMDHAVRALGDAFVQTWSSLLRLELNWDELRFEPAFLSLRTNDADWVFSARFSWTLGAHVGTLTWVWPLTELAPLAAQLARHSHPEDNALHPKAQPEAGWHETLQKTPVTLTAQLGSMRLRLADVAKLQVGGILPLSTRITDPFPILIDHVPKFRGLPGASQGRYAVTILPATAAEASEEASAHEEPIMPPLA